MKADRGRSRTQQLTSADDRVHWKVYGLAKFRAGTTRRRGPTAIGLAHPACAALASQNRITVRRRASRRATLDRDLQNGSPFTVLRFVPVAHFFGPLPPLNWLPKLSITLMSPVVLS